MAPDAIAVAMLRDVMRLRRVQVKDAAGRLGISYRRLQNYLYGQSDMPLGVFFALADMLGVSVDWLRAKPPFEFGHFQQALTDVFGDKLPVASINENGLALSERPPGQAADRASAATLALFIRDAYNTHLNRALRVPLDPTASDPPKP